MNTKECVAKAAEAMAHLYVWESVMSILQGSATPDRQDAKADREVQKVVRIARAETKRLVSIYDAHVATLATTRQEPTT